MTSTRYRNIVLNVPLMRSEVSIKMKASIGVTYSPNRNAKGMLLFPSEAVIMADETKGPMNADVLPTYHMTMDPEFRRTKRGKYNHLPLRITRKTGTLLPEGYYLAYNAFRHAMRSLHLGKGRYFADHCLTICVPWTNHQAVESLV